MRLEWDRRFAEFARQQRGEKTLEEFARQTGIPRSTLHRFELNQNKVPLHKVELLVRSLNCTINHVIPSQFPHCSQIISAEDFS
jgi:transcriptional regulator with XRE-family HTH domain